MGKFIPKHLHFDKFILKFSSLTHVKFCFRCTAVCRAISQTSALTRTRRRSAQISLKFQPRYVIENYVVHVRNYVRNVVIVSFLVGSFFLLILPNSIPNQSFKNILYYNSITTQIQGPRNWSGSTYIFYSCHRL